MSAWDWAREDEAARREAFRAKRWAVSVWEDGALLRSDSFGTEAEARAYAEAQARLMRSDMLAHPDEYPDGIAHIEGAAYVEAPGGIPSGGWGWDASSVDTVEWA